jgi:hypothetical protein
MYKKIVFTKSSSQNMEEINSLARTAIKDFLVNKGWTVKGDLSNGCNFCLVKNFNNQNNSVNFENNKSVLNFYDKKWFYNGSSWTTFDPNGDFHLSISRPLHNSRVLSITPCENPTTKWSANGNFYQNSSDHTRILGYNATDEEISKLCSQDSNGYVDSGERYSFNGAFKKRINRCENGKWDFTFDNNWNNLNGGSNEYTNSMLSSHVRLDDTLTELSLEMFYFIDDDLQEEFYFIFRTNQLFGRKAPQNNNFYQTLGFVKMPGYPIMCTSTIYESPNHQPAYNNTKVTSKVWTDSVTGVKGFLNYGVNAGVDFDLSYNGTKIPNMSTTQDVSADFNPRWDAPDDTPDLWLHHVVANWCPTLQNPTYSQLKDYVSSLTSRSSCRKHTMKIFGVKTFFYFPYCEEDGHIVYACCNFRDCFGSYEFIYQQGCSSETGTTLLAPIQRQHQNKMHRNGPRHCKWYNMFYTTPEKILDVEKDDVSHSWKCYPCKRRSIAGYVNFLNTYYGKIYWKNPVSDEKNSEGVHETYYNVAGDTPTRKLYWFLEDYTSSTTGQPILTDTYIGAELDASGFEGFAIDYSNFSEDNVENVDL